jgi:hypothetical protein
VSLLDTANEVVTVFLEVVTTDDDGNTATRPSVMGIETPARIQPLGYQSDSSETQDGGFNTSSRYGLRFPRSWPHVLGAQSAIEWSGKRWSVVGDPIHPQRVSPYTTRPLRD